MTARTIVTSQPDVACDVCERRLLRGEQHEIFLAAGHRRTVCELCAPRAAHQGWKRETDEGADIGAGSRPRRARGFLERLRAGTRAQDAHIAGVGGEGMPDVDGRVFDGQEERGVEESLLLQAGPLERALAAFNAGEYPRRIGGVARSLGAPEVNVRELDVTGVVAIVVAWELCWYRYRVDLDDVAGGARLVAQGTELAELEREERHANASADEHGELYLIAAG